MGSAMIQGWLTQGLLKQAEILNPSDIDDSLSSHPDLFHVKLMESLTFKETDIVILAVKPQIMDSVCESLAPLLPPDIPVLSVAAGKDTKYFQDRIPQCKTIIRAMPNMAVAISKGMTGLYASDNITPSDKEMIDILFNALGQTLWIDDENKMDAITAISGSGPGYLFYFTELMMKAGISIGFTQDEAKKLALQTIIGASALMEADDDADITQMRQNVTSKGGTTQAALDTLMQGEFEEILINAVKAAEKRGQELKG